MKKYLVILLLLTASTSYASWTEQSRSSTAVSITAGDVVSRVRQIIDDKYSDTGSVRYSSATILELVSKGHQMICLQTQALTTSATSSFVLGTTTYALPDDCLFLQRVTLSVTGGVGSGTENFKYLPQKTVWGLDMENKSWDISSSTPTAFYIQNRYIGFYPAPSFTGAEVQIWYTKYPADLTSTSDYIFDGYTQLQPFSEFIAIYAASKLALVEGNVNLFTSLLNEYNGGVTLMNGMLKFSPLYAPNNVMDNK